MNNEKKCSVKWEKSDKKKRVTINLEDKLEMVITEDEGRPESVSVNCEHSIGESITIGQLTFGKELPADTVIFTQSSPVCGYYWNGWRYIWR